MVLFHDIFYDLFGLDPKEPHGSEEIFVIVITKLCLFAHILFKVHSSTFVFQLPAFLLLQNCLKSDSPW